MCSPRRIVASLAALTLSLTLGQAQAAITSQANDPFLQGWSAYESGHYAVAAQHWAPLAEQGDPSAQLNLGTLYDYGQGVTQDSREALRWYEAAAKQGKAIAQFNLGVMYEQGRGAAPDLHRAAQWYSQAAAQGIADAQFNLGLLFAEGRGIEANPELAVQWLFQAAQGYLEADRIEHVQGVIARIEELPGAAPYVRELSEQLSSLGHSATEGPWENASVGTGWPTSGGYVVTNDHVIGNSEQVVLIDVNGREISAQVVTRDATSDLALLSVSDPAFLPPPLPLSAGRAKLGTSVFTIGFPRIDVLGKTPKLTAGLVSAVNGLRDDPSRYQLSLPIQSGNSGGPLINMHGEVVGVVTSMLGSVDDNGNTSPIGDVSYAVKVDFLHSMLSALPRQAAQAPTPMTLAGSGLENLADRIQNSVLIVRAK